MVEDVKRKSKNVLNKTKSRIRGIKVKVTFMDFIRPSAKL